MRAKIVALSLLVLLAPAAPASAQQKQRFANLTEALQAGGALSGGSGPRSVNWIDGGRRFSFITRGQDGEEIRAMDPATGQDTLLFSARGVSFPDTAAPFTYRSFEWSRDSRFLVFQTNFRPIYRRSGISDFYVYSLADHSLQPAAKGARTGQLSPDGTMLGLERGGDMYVYDLAQRRERRLTTGATDDVYNGHFDWVYEEEFGLAQAWSWSNDSHYIAFWQVNDSAEPVDRFTDFAGHHPSYDDIRIPQPGDSNPTVKIGVADVRSGATVWLDPGETGDFYIPRIYWTSEPDTLAMITLNRRQDRMNLYFFDVRTGGKRLVMSDSAWHDTWIDVYDFYASVQDLMTFPDGVRQFFWISDRDGWQHVYRYDYSGRLVNQVTHGDWSVTRVEGIDPGSQTIYYTSTEATPLQRQLYAIRFDGTGERRITQTAGTHGIDMSPDTRFFIDRWSSVSQPRLVELWQTASVAAPAAPPARGRRGRAAPAPAPTPDRMLRRLEDNASVTQWLTTHAYAPTELFSFTTSDGQRLDGSMVKPLDFDSTRRYPVVFAIYGGPGSQGVYDAFGTSTFTQWLAQQGYIVINLNNRGSNNYGSQFMKVVYGSLGKWEAHDFAEAARWLAGRPYVDGSHIGIIGTSYGGYATLYTMARYPDIFTVGVANSPPTDWRLYDTIYTERYMGLMPDNTAGYDSSSVLVNARGLTGHLLLIHSLLDDNVHVQNTMQLLTALTNLGRDVDLRIYPPGHHGAAYNFQSAILITRNTDAWLDRWLRGVMDTGTATR